MMKVSQNMAFTVNLGNYQSAKVEIGIHDIDTDGDVEQQIAEAKETFDKVFIEVYKKVQQEVSYIMKEQE
jgi:hypothetical protein|tara:strand:- start:66 stop:275 length:210 start_codon:yes stop_codon:yes gene_type:complete